MNIAEEHQTVDSNFKINGNVNHLKALDPKLPLAMQHKAVQNGKQFIQQKKAQKPQDLY